MRQFALQRIRASLIAIFLASVLVFIGVRALPGDPAVALAGEERDPQAIAEVREKYGLDQPIPVQYWNWITLAAQGDLGRSIRTGIPVSDLIFTRIPITVQLAVMSMAVAVLVGIPTGVLAAVRRGRPADYVSNAVGLAGLSIPNFWLGLMLILLFAITWRVLPASGYAPIGADPVESLRRMLMPAVVLGTSISAILMRQMRSSMMESMSADYVRTARAKGLREHSVIVGHAVRNSLITVVTILGLQLGGLISGAAVTERIFTIPGFGALSVDAVFTRDYPVIQGVVLIAAVGYIVINLVVDLLYSLLNPRIRVAGENR